MKSIAFILISIIISTLFSPFILSYTNEALDDQIDFLPYSIGDQQSNQFSGFLNLNDDNDKYIHYMYFESENNPDEDPIVFWTNGGPGCSGLLGLFTEFGPWRPIRTPKKLNQFNEYNTEKDNDTEIFNSIMLVRNPFTWVRNASIVFLEQPVGVGFSHSKKPISRVGYHDYMASKDNLAIIKAFFKKFPERNQQAFIISSESYGGHYIPQWTLQIFNDRSQEGTELRKRFKGFLLGNPFTSFASGSIAMANAIWGLQLAPKPLWDRFTSLNCDDLSQDAMGILKTTPECFVIIDHIFSYTESLNPYALEYPTCTESYGDHDIEHHNKDSTNIDINIDASKVSSRNGSTIKPPSSIEVEHLELKRKVGMTSSAQMRHLFKLYRRLVHDQVKDDDFGSGNGDDKFDFNYRSILDDHNKYRKSVNNADSSSDSGSGSGGGNSKRRIFGDVGHESDYISSLSKKHVVEIYPDQILPYDPCAEQSTIAYLNDPSVQTALHVDGSYITPIIAKADDDLRIPGDDIVDTDMNSQEDQQHYHGGINHEEIILSDGRVSSTDVNAHQWNVCNDAVNQHWAFNDYLSDTTSLYSTIYAHKNKPSNFQMLIYSGDVDGVCATVGTQHWIYNISTTTQPISIFDSWYFEDITYGHQKGGSLSILQDDLKFMTVRFAGHEVPAYQPQSGLAMFQMFLKSIA